MSNYRPGGSGRRSTPPPRPAWRAQSQKTAREEFLDGPRASYRPSSSAAAGRAQRTMLSGRVMWVMGLSLVLVAALIVRLMVVQLVWGPSFADQAAEQRTRIYVDNARRGAIVDRNGNQIALTMQARSLTVSPNRLRDDLEEQSRLELVSEEETAGNSDEEIADRAREMMEDTLDEMAQGIPEMIEEAEASSADVEEKEIKDKLTADSSYEVLVRNVDPDVAALIAERYYGIAADYQAVRQYPNGAVGENVVGRVSMDGQGQFGYEASGDSVLSGIDGSYKEDVSTDGQVIPGSRRDEVDAVDGSTVELTLDVDLQNHVQQVLERAKANSLAEDAEAVVLDAHTAQVLAMANTSTIDPNGDIEKQLEEGRSFENPSISAPFEPGSVAKVITASGVIQEGLTTPDEVLQVPGSIEMSGVTVNDAWAHGVASYTTTGVFGKSSNVGTLMLAQRLGEDKYAEYLKKFGIGQATGIELPNESQGLLADRSQWSGGTFANLPIGQGMSWTTLQMASVYQALANGGQRVEPRVISSVTGPDGTQEEQTAPATTQVVSPETARTVLDMFRSVTQDDPNGVQQGTGPEAAVDGYQIAGKTGTAQKVDEATGAYSMNRFWITFAGVAPADDPRYVVAIMLDEPKRGVKEGGGGASSSAPLFHDIASWLLDRDNVPLSPPVDGQLILQAQ